MTRLRNSLMAPMTAAALVLAIAACRTSGEQPTESIVVDEWIDFPDLRDEEVTPSPGPDHTWVPGHWNRTRTDWEWIPGGWTKPPHHRAHWAPGHWREDTSKWRWVKGSWRVAPSEGVQSTTYVAVPKPREEIQPDRPSDEHRWVGGHWERTASDWDWIAGEWRLPPSSESYWQNGYWRWHDETWHWTRGHWRATKNLLVAEEIDIPVALVEKQAEKPIDANHYVPGHWDWQGHWSWVPGYWTTRPHADADWIAGHWEGEGDEHRWIGGHWKLR